MSDMEVLKDLKQLISTPKETPEVEQLKKRIRELESEREELRAKCRELEEEVARLQERVASREEEIKNLKPSGPEPGCEVVSLENRRSELSSAISEAEELLRMKLGQLLQRVALAFQTEGFGEMSALFKKGARSLEVLDPEELSELLRLVLKS